MEIEAKTDLSPSELDEDSVIPPTYISAKLREVLMDPDQSIGVSYRRELKRLTLCFAQYVLTLADQIRKERGDREITPRHVQEALEEADFEHYWDKIPEQFRGKFKGAKAKVTRMAA
jgi:hypothetical protein